ncbi:MAG: KpsF/GutQ family sugar-phosphate isomerase [Planctomycetes bacterium]|nr:KpsF/GutQ family sugar-phosphate isomerase [Planctomycetota bacterium]
MDPRIERAREIVASEAAAVRGVGERIGTDFLAAVDRILALDGRVVTAGMGKAGIIAQKLSATFASTGTNSIYLHPAEAIHGDLGRVSPGDLLLALSKSGTTDEVLRLLAPVKAAGCTVVAMTQSRESPLARHADLVLELGPIAEAGSLALAPTASTTAMLALGDALAIVVQEGRRFGPEDFARFHPGGDLGRRLMRVEELMRTGDRNPMVRSGATVLEALSVMTRTPGRPGATSIVDATGRLLGFFTDGDLRRLLEQGHGRDVDTLRIDAVMTRAPRTIPPDTFALEAVAFLHQLRVDQLPVVDERERVLGLLDVQDLLDLRIG